MKDSNYTRVLPRDLFNEAKLLKCIGRLTLLIHDKIAPIGLDFEHDGDSFNIALDDVGNLQITNIRFSFNDQILTFQTTYNSKANYPLYLIYDYCECAVFNENGDFDSDFLTILKTL